MASKNLIKNVQSILPIIRGGAALSEQSGCLQESVLEAIYVQRLFRLFIPQKYKGESTDLPTALKVFEQVAWADGATGWLVMIGSGGGLFSGFLEEHAARVIYEPEHAVIAGSGMPNGTAISSKSGFKVSGRWAYASGSSYATYFTANCKVEGNEEVIRSVAMPANQVNIHKTWDVLGMGATGSHDFSVDNVSVQSKFTFSLAETPQLDDPIFLCPLEILGSLSFTSVAIGISQHAMDSFIEFAKQKTVPEANCFLINVTAIKHLCEQSEALICDSRNRLYQLAEQVWETTLQGEIPSTDLQNNVTEENVKMVQNLVTLVDSLKVHAGMMAVFTTSEFGRAWRDLHTMSQHSIVRPRLG